MTFTTRLVAPQRGYKPQTSESSNFKQHHIVCICSSQINTYDLMVLFDPKNDDMTKPGDSFSFSQAETKVSWKTKLASRARTCSSTFENQNANSTLFQTKTSPSFRGSTKKSTKQHQTSLKQDKTSLFSVHFFLQQNISQSHVFLRHPLVVGSQRKRSSTATCSRRRSCSAKSQRRRFSRALLQALKDTTVGSWTDEIISKAGCDLKKKNL